MSSHYPANYPGYQSGYSSYPSYSAYSGYAAAPLNSAWQLAKVGAVVGACGAGAQNLRRYQDQEVDPATAWPPGPPAWWPPSSAPRRPSPCSPPSPPARR